jgi:hypothetical protein
MLDQNMFEERTEEGEMIVYPDLKDAIVGIVSRFGQEDIICYDYDKCIEIFMEQGMTHEEALEWFDYNTIGSWVGDTTPCFLEKIQK